MENQYYRTFIGLPVQVGTDLLEARHELITSLEGERISWVDPKRFHITLRFLGDTRLCDVDRIGRALKEGEFMPHTTSVPVTGLGSFGPRKKPRVIWIGFGLKEWFSGLKDGVDSMLEECGFPKQDPPFTAHLTLGRIRSLRDLSRYYEIMEGMEAKSYKAVWFDRLIYYRSILGSRGPEYSKLEEILFRKA
jgi:2'-5' RNA ligase